MKSKKFIAIIATICILLIQACSLPSLIATNGTGSDPAANMQTQVALNIALTNVAQTMLANAIAETLAAMPSNTPEFTFTPSLTPTPTFTFTPEVARVSVSVETNCRSGPGNAYDKLGALFPGQTADVVGRNSSSDTWIIKLPSNPAVTCWLWGQYATVIGNASGLPVFTPPPTPTPTMNFNLDYVTTLVCGGFYGIQLRIVNTGGITWESNRVVAFDQTANNTKSIDRDNFPVYTNGTCAISSASQNLEPGETGLTNSSGFNYNIFGNTILVTVTVCSQDGMTGTCLPKTITIVP
ncbi:MAG: hypothetical protein ABIF04_03575 [Chloroflexota bacterium]